MASSLSLVMVRVLSGGSRHVHPYIKSVLQGDAIDLLTEIGMEMERLIDGLGFEIVSVTSASERRIVLAYEKWGKGLHQASPNFGDCFAHVVAKDHGCPLSMREQISRKPISQAQFD